MNRPGTHDAVDRSFYDTINNLSLNIIRDEKSALQVTCKNLNGAALPTMKIFYFFLFSTVILSAGMASAVVTKDVTVTWSVANGTDIDSYNLYYDTTSAMTNKVKALNCDTPNEDPPGTFTMTCTNLALDGSNAFFSIGAVKDGKEYFSPAVEKQVTFTLSPVQGFRIVTDGESQGADDITINFQPANAPVPTGYQMDSGGPFNATAGYGWTNSPGTVGTRDRNDPASPDQAHDTFIHVDPTGVWEHVVPNGSYTVTITVGDPLAPDSIHSIRAEGTPIIDQVSLNSSTRWVTKSGTVNVTDGRLTLTFQGSSPYAKICLMKLSRNN